jgi:zinc transport system permease protein
MLIIILTSILISLIFAPLGCIVLWKKYVCFGDGLSHASLLAVSITIISNIPLIYSGLIVAIIFAVSISRMKVVSENNAAVSLIASFMFSVSLIIMYLSENKINIQSLLLGDIISSSIGDIAILTAILILAASFISIFYNKILLIVLNRDIAKIKGLNVEMIELIFLVILSLSIFSTIKIVGSLLVTSILLIPALTAKLFSKTPIQMIAYSIIVALLSNSLGLFVAFYLDIPVTPIIVVTGVIIYFITYSALKISRDIY